MRSGSLRFGFWMLCLATPGFVLAKPYVPASDHQVLERLPFRANDPVARELTRLRTELQRDKTNLAAALSLARRYYGLVGEEGDPRYLGYAQAALTPWWGMENPPSTVQVMRASIRQYRHDFSGAVADLSAVIGREPEHVEARILRAMIHIVQARYSEARIDCEAVREHKRLIGSGCNAMVDGITGKASAAYQDLSAVLAQYPKAPSSEKLWVHIRLAELAQRQGQAQAAERHYRQSLSQNIEDGFLLASYADFLLDQRRFSEVVALLKDKTRSDVLLLRLAFAERALNLPAAAEHEAAMAARFRAAQLRGESVHQQEEARFALQVEKNPQKALDLARENWKVQREPRDARIYLEAAIAANDTAAAEPVLEWLSTSGIEDRNLLDLGRRLREKAR